MGLAVLRSGDPSPSRVDSGNSGMSLGLSPFLDLFDVSARILNGIDIGAVGGASQESQLQLEVVEALLHNV